MDLHLQPCYFLFFNKPHTALVTSPTTGGCVLPTERGATRCICPDEGLHGYSTSSHTLQRRFTDTSFIMSDGNKHVNVILITFFPFLHSTVGPNYELLIKSIISVSFCSAELHNLNNCNHWISLSISA